MSDIVVNKIFRLSAEDNVTPTLSRVSQSFDKLTKPKTTKFDISADESKVQQYASQLDGLSKTHQTKLEAIADKMGFDNFDSYMRTLPKDIQTELKAKFDKQAFESAKHDYDSLPKEKKTKLEAIAEQRGFTTYKAMYNAVPKEARTRLDFIANKGEFSEINREIAEITKPITKKVNVDSSSVDTATKKFGHLKEIIAGTFAGQMISNGVNQLTSGLKSATQAGMEYNKEQDTMKTVWTALTTEAPRDGKELVNYINSLSQHSIYAADTINEMAQSFYHVHSNVDETKRWTNSFVALGSTLHMSNSALAESGEMFAKIVAGGKAGSEDMAVMINRFPMFGEALQKATGKSMKELYAMSAAGKLSATQFTETLDYLGKKYSGGTQEAMTSYMGMGMYIHSRFSKLMGDIMSQTFDTTKSASGAIRDLLSDDAMQKYSKAIGSATGKVLNGIGDIIKYIDSHKETIMKIGKDVGEIASIFGKAIWNDIKSIMTTIAEKFGLVDKNAKSSADPLKTFESILSAIAKHKTAISNIAGALLAIKGFKMAKGVFDPLAKIAGIGDKNKGGLFTKIVGTGDNSQKVARKPVEFIGHWTWKGLKGFGRLIKTGGSKTLKFVGKWTWKGLKGAGGLIGKGASKATTYTVKAVVSGAGKVKDLALAGKDLAVAFGAKTIGALKTFGTTMMTLGKTALMNPYVDIALAVIGLGVAFYEAYKHIKPFRDAMNKLGGSIVKGVKTGIDGAKKLFTGKLGWEQAIGKETGKIGKNIQSGFKTGTDWVKKHKTEITASLVNPFAGVTAWFLKDTKTGKNVTKWVSGLEKSVKTSTKGKKGLGNNLTGIFKGVGDWLIKDKSTKKGFDKWMSGLESSVKNSTKGKKGLLSNLTGTFDGVAKWFNKDKKTKKAMQTWSDGLGKIFSGKKGFAKLFSDSLDSMTKSLRKSKFGKAWDGFWKDTQKTTTSWDKNISKWWSGFTKDFGKKWDKTWKDRKAGMHDTWKGMHSAYDDFTTGIGTWWSGFSKDFGKDWNQGWKDRKTDIHDRWKGMHTAYDDFTTGINTWWSGFKSSFKSGWDSFWKGVQKLFKDIFGTFKDLAHDAMKGVVGAINGGIGGINTVIKFFGGKAQSIAPIKYAGGVGYHPGGPALINDQKGPLFEEAFKNPGEPWRVIPKMRNVMVDLKPGATVVPATETAQRFAPSSVPHYANGVGGWIKGELSDMGSWVKDKLEGITDFLKDPLGNLTSVWDKATSKISQATKFGSTFAPPAGHYVVKQSINWVKDQLSKLKDKELEAQSVAGDPKAAQAWLPIVKKVLKDMGANPPNGIDWEAAAYVREIARESGGNAAIRQQISDKNSLAGNPAMGLLQFIPQTFMAYAVPGHTNILSGVDQIMATTNAYMHNGGWNRIGTGRQINFLANGGWMTSPTYLGNGNVAGEVAGEPEVVINPARPSALPLMNQLMYKMADFHPEFKSSNLMGNISSDIGQKLDAVINLLGSINGKNFAPEINVVRTSNNLNQQNQRDTAVYGYMQGNRQ
ncbi:hypothetical protein D1B17_07030 [Companilactobacillus zhachilii]|uniref:Transglycosylase SLT domain-containing protein n=1 Tax=Companilactobacillus zhachilii TaxID=2304606 RepID=A0A386PSG8_9LACO|nr:tape measure protein [Companilactobacillus zhachilii]AYE38402.1 hypothetical protein D1B17_07030 [Companilactobacillus zhachilii]